MMQGLAGRGLAPREKKRGLVVKAGAMLCSMLLSLFIMAGCEGSKVRVEDQVLPVLQTGLSAAEAIQEAIDRERRLERVRERVRALSDTELVEEYCEPGHRVHEPGFAKAEGLPPPWCEENAQYVLFQLVREELVRRGGSVVPLLIELLRREASKDRVAPTRSYSGFPNYYVRDLVDVLVRIRDPSAAGALLEVLEGLDGGATKRARCAAKSGLERLTYCAYHRGDPDWGNHRHAVGRLGAEPRGPERKPGLDKIAAFYRDWLAGEGKDAAQWLALACRRARRILEGEDLRAIYCAVEFLLVRQHWRRLAPRRDDDPARTLGRLAEILGQVRGGRPYKEEGLTLRDYFYKGQKLPVSTGNWTELIAAYGPLARPHAGVLIRIQRETGLADPGGFRNLCRIGGKEVVAYLIECLPEFERKLTRLKPPPLRDTHACPDRKLSPIQEEMLRGYRGCRYGIDRWAGRAFENSEERLSWWQANKYKAPERWLHESLPITAAAADEGHSVAQDIVRAMLPDLPRGQDETCWAPFSVVVAISPHRAVKGPFRVKWLNEHRKELQYDPSRGAFRLAEDSDLRGMIEELAGEER